MRNRSSQPAKRPKTVTRITKLRRFLFDLSEEFLDSPQPRRLPPPAAGGSRVPECGARPPMSGSKLRIALAQINTVVGDFGGNEKRILDALKRATQLGADLVAFPELTVTGYPPEDLLLRHSFVERSERLVRALAPQVKGVTAVVGFPERRNGKLYNAAAILCDGEVATTYQKIHLP
ncbi:MAG TPA: hypothetical protein ENK07_07585, partial [Bacteroidetes bacterium]|nr:hypothetical protein [Bacteroidota bacterium]